MTKLKSGSIEFKVDKNKVANLVFDLKGERVNKLSEAVLLDLEIILNKVRDDKNIKALVISSNKKDIFIAGADINEIKNIKDSSDAIKKVSQGQNILDKIEELLIPTIAVINGACLGGGLELALSCRYRIVIDSEKTKLGLPEVSLGIIPGFGGTQRLPKLVGLVQSLSMILSGKAVDYKKAYRIGLADIILREEFAENGVKEFVDDVLKKPNSNRFLKKRSESKKKHFIKETLFFGKYLILHLAKKNLLKKTKGHYPAPMAALDVIKRSYNKSNKYVGIRIEAEEFSKLATGSVAKNLIDLFFISEEIKKDSGVEKSEKVKEVKKAALLGAGIMGGGIAWLFSNYNIIVRMKDISNNGIALGYNQIIKIYSQLKKIRKYNDNQINLKMGQISSTLDYSGFKDCDIVVEAVIEDMKIKQDSLAEVEKHISSDAIIATNTSSLSLLKMGSKLKDQTRFVGMHFFNPVNRMPLVEVIKSEKTSDKSVASIVSLSKRLGKTPIVVKDVPGFLVNRILLPYINEAGFLLEEGADIKTVDRLIEDFGLPMGPFTLADTVGIDVGYKVAKILEESYGDRMKVCDLLTEISKNKDLLGKKSYLGFFKYDKSGKKLGVNPAINSILNKISYKKSGIYSQDIVDRSILIMVNEATKCLEECVVKNAKHLDMAMIMGTGFPAFRGGLLKYADGLGIGNVVVRLDQLRRKYGIRFKPSTLLVKMSKSGQKFY